MLFHHILIVYSKTKLLKISSSNIILLKMNIQFSSKLFLQIENIISLFLYSFIYVIILVEKQKYGISCKQEKSLQYCNLLARAYI